MHVEVIGLAEVLAVDLPREGPVGLEAEALDVGALHDLGRLREEPRRAE